MSRHLDGSPKPVDPIWYRQHEVLQVRCRCGHQASGVIGLIALRAGMGGHERLWVLVRRLRCSRCDARDPVVEVGR
jgi:hypothetical protein